MPKLLALGGPRHGRLVFVDEAAQDVAFDIAPALRTDPTIHVRYRRARLPGGEEVLVHEDVPSGADLGTLVAEAREAYRTSGQWDDAAP